MAADLSYGTIDVALNSTASAALKLHVHSLFGMLRDPSFSLIELASVLLKLFLQKFEVF